MIRTNTRSQNTSALPIPIILSILTLGFFIRTFELGSHSLWLDEVYSFKRASLGTQLEVLDYIRKQSDGIPPPLYEGILLHNWIRLFGIEEFSVRYLSAILGVLAIAAIYLLGKTVFNVRVGIVSAFLLTVSSLHILQSRESRMYPLVALLISPAEEKTTILDWVRGLCNP